MKVNYLFLGLLLIFTGVSKGQDNIYPASGDVTIFNYSPSLVLQRNTNEGGFIQGIQTKLFDGTNNWYFGALHSNSWVVSKGDYQGIKFSILDNGSIGIGTITPEKKVHISGNNDVLRVGPYYSDVDRDFVDIIAHPTDTKILSNNERFHIENNIGHLVLQGTSGNILIGKTSQANPDYKLDINGIIRADEVVVNTTGADYVFAPEYNLPTLSEVEKFINENNHLPDMAPAAEMQEKGMNVSEMQTKLLQKIEELTLYLIELKRENENQSKEILVLKNQIKDHNLNHN